ncbi:MAG: cytochrome c oxidase accessory protein CcoG [Thiothrix sp.]|nr:cytochrome c oxidase accessory protein CcoG [Thiothrix sp.]HPQ95132.1 cytochrome c oxidase accessory protein CcoG [Thiolinea sp.]
MSTVQIIQPRHMIQPRSIRGRFRNLKTGVMVLAYWVYFLLPWLRWTRGNGVDQAILFDINQRRYYLFDLVMYPQDVFWLTAFLFLAAVLLFFITTLLGRVFCGYFCFQTLWTDAFRWIERLVQGDQVARVRLNKAPWGREKLFKLGLTHVLWLLLAFWTGLTFTLYWADAPTLVHDFFTGQADVAAYVTTFLLMATTYLAAAWIREFVCLHICPYSRFQSVMFDRDTLVVAYDYNRGEGDSGRAKAGKGLRDRAVRREQGHGDCIDCGLCVQVCPTGIDIRNGLQINCIHCALCIDACDSIMERQGWERGLIRYSSENELGGGKTRFFKLRTIGYGMATLLAAVYLVWSLGHTVLLEANAQQVRNPLFVTLSDGAIQNSYEIKINNKTLTAGRYRLSLQELDQAVLDLGHQESGSLAVEPDSSLRLLARVKMNAAVAAGNHDFHFLLEPLTGESREPVLIPAQFIGP